MSDNFWRKLIETSLETADEEISCMECFELLDQYVDLLDEGEKPALVLPELEQHLTVCDCCHTELEALLIALRSAVETEQ